MRWYSGQKTDIQHFYDDEKFAVERVEMIFEVMSSGAIYSKLTFCSVADLNAEIYAVGDLMKAPHSDEYYVKCNVPEEIC